MVIDLKPHINGPGQTCGISNVLAIEIHCTTVLHHDRYEDYFFYSLYCIWYIYVSDGWETHVKCSVTSEIIYALKTSVKSIFLPSYFSRFSWQCGYIHCFPDVDGVVDRTWHLGLRTDHASPLLHGRTLLWAGETRPRPHWRKTLYTAQCPGESKYTFLSLFYSVKTPRAMPSMFWLQKPVTRAGFSTKPSTPWLKLITLLVLNSLAPGRFEKKFRWVIFKLISVTDGWGISYKIALRWMPFDLTDDKSTLVQVLALCHQATSCYLSQCWPRFVWPQYLNIKMSSYQYRDSHYKDKTVSQPSYLYNWNPIHRKTVFILRQD